MVSLMRVVYANMVTRTEVINLKYETGEMDPAHESGALLCLHPPQRHQEGFPA